ncbi:hypothetical protein ABZX39_18835 [Streptomyces collinus]|uniref:hypothetical protein n=1 Tax=Streptomyces collinus TaxID=42684 RepID=UPI0033AE1B05
MDALAVLASAAFGSTIYLTTFSAVRWLNQMASRAKVMGLVLIGMLLCAVIALVAYASQGVAVGFIVGAGITPPVHRWIQQRRRHVASS